MTVIERKGNLNPFPADFDHSPEAWTKLGRTSTSDLPKAKQPKAEKATKASAPKQAKPKAVANTQRTACLCGCGGFPSSAKSRFVPGHDGRLKGILIKAIRLGDKAAITRMNELGWAKFLP